MAIDPICKMTVNEAKARFTSVHEGKTFYFCSPGCKREFDKHPAQWAT